MTEFVREVKRKLRDVYHLTPSRVVGDEPCFDNVPDGIYPMEIHGRQEDVVIVDQRFYFLRRMVAPQGRLP